MRIYGQIYYKDEGPCRIITSQVTKSLVSITIHADVLTYFELFTHRVNRVEFGKMLSYQYKENTYKPIHDHANSKFDFMIVVKIQKKKTQMSST